MISPNIWSPITSLASSLRDVQLELRRRLCKPRELQVVDMARQRLRWVSLGASAAAGKLPILIETSGPSGPFPCARSFPSTEISVLSGEKRTSNRCQPGVRASRWTGSAGPLGDSTANTSSAQPGTIRTRAGPFRLRNVRSIDHRMTRSDRHHRHETPAQIDRPRAAHQVCE